MRIGIAWAKALLPVGFVLVAAATAGAQYGPSPYAPPGQGGYIPPYADAPQFAPVQYAQPDASGAPPIFYDEGGYAPQGMASEGYGGMGEEYCPPEHGVPFLGQPRPYGTGGITHPRWFDVGADYMIFTRDNARRFVPFSSLGVGGPTVLSTDFLNFETASGFRVTGNYLVGTGRNLEASYFGTFNFTANSQALAGPPNLFSPFSNFGAGALTGFDDSLLHTIAYSTNLHSAELNLRQRYLSPNGRVHTSLLAGFRYICIDEDFLFSAAAGATSGQYLVGTSNDLIGFQLGGDICVAVLPRLKFGAEAKAGVYGNDAQQRNRITETTVGAGTVTVFEAASANNCSFGGEAGAFMLLHITPRWNLKAGYQCLVATGLAIAPENFNPDPNFGARVLNVNVGGHAFYHGGQAGFEYVY